MLFRNHSRRPWLAGVVCLCLCSCGSETPPTDSKQAEAAAKQPKEPGLRVMFDVSEFRLLDQDANEFVSTSLRGKVWIASFIFTRCGYTCPAQTKEFSQLQKQFKQLGYNDVHLVSISVDPHFDRPEVLREYAQNAEADLQSWTFLTGERDTIWNLIKDDFKLSVFEDDNNPEALIAHSQKFALVDRQMRIRGYYDALEPSAVAKMVGDIEVLRQEPFEAESAANATAEN